MNERPAYVDYHPRWYRPRMSTWWWMERWSYLLFILREVSSAFVAWSVAYLLLIVYSVSQGKFPTWASDPFMVALNVVSLLFVTYHAVTWFNLAPKAMVVRLRGKAVPGTWIAAANYLAWVLVSALVTWVLLGG